ncbi:bifunctional lysylphosphatidylglycerol flippase/synthetase MprF [Nocardia sp. NPDC003482]
MPLDGLLPPPDIKGAFAALRDHADNPSAFLALNEGNEYYTDPEIDGMICYRRRRKYWIQFGGPFCPPGQRHRLQSSFFAHARSRRQKIIALQLQSEDALLWADMGMSVNQMGASYAVDLGTHSLRGKHFVSLRNKISRAKRAGLEIREVTAADFADDIDRIDRMWLRDKGRHAKELQFLIGEIGGAAQAYRRLFLGFVAHAPIGYISYAPVFGRHAGWLHDLSRRHPDSPPGVMEALNAHAIEVFRAENAAWLHFGFTPFTGLADSHRTATENRMVARLVRVLAEHGEAIYPARTQLEYKSKWAPALILPEYLGFTGRLTPGAVWNLLRVINIL